MTFMLLAHTKAGKVAMGADYGQFGEGSGQVESRRGRRRFKGGTELISAAVTHTRILPPFPSLKSPEIP